MKRIFVITCLACYGIINTTEVSANHPPTPSIALTGTLGGGQIRTLIIEAYLNATSVDVIFNIDLGSLTVDVINQSGETVFKTAVDAVTGGTLPIDTSGWESGEYILLIMDGQGGYFEGSFLIN